MTFLWCVLWDDTFKLPAPILYVYLYLQGIKKKGLIVAASSQHPILNPLASLLQVSDSW